VVRRGILDEIITMLNAYVVAGIVAAVLLALGLSRLIGRRREELVSFANDREEQLTLRLATMLRCSPVQALPWLRKELEFASDQTDENLLKRAAYHFRRDQPETTCSMWRDRSPG
jgi:hypothetical protein